MTGAAATVPDATRGAGARIVCIGDAMLDAFVYGGVDRLSPEAPIPVFRVGEEKRAPGGAANVACNVAALGGRATLIAVVGDDERAQTLGASLAAAGVDAVLVRDPARVTTSKTRFVASGQQMLRVDDEAAAPLAPSVREALLSALERALPGAAVLLVSDYAKGVCHDEVLRRAMTLAAAHGASVIVDPKGEDYSRYRGAALLTPNARELQVATGLATAADADVETAALHALEQFGFPAILVTRSAKGLSLILQTGAPVHVAGLAREVFDVCGAGDSVLAALGVALAGGASLEEAARLANVAGAIAVSKQGTAVVREAEWRSLASHPAADAAGGKVVSRETLCALVTRWRKDGLTIGFTNGCFDLIHAGHITLLNASKAACDKLVVAVNSDQSVARLKGPGRPVMSEQARTTVLASLAQVDAVCVFPEDTPMALIEALRPDVLAKGADYAMDQIVGADFVRAYGGEVLRVAHAHPLSTSQTIARIRDRSA